MKISPQKPLVWLIGGSDSGGGAGIQADLNTCASFSVHGCTIITAITAQNTQGVHHIVQTSAESLSAQFKALQKDLPPKAIKIGMIGDESTLEIIAECLTAYLSEHPEIPLILDPVLRASSGDSLVSGSDTKSTQKTYQEQLISALFPLATLITPNLTEAEYLWGKSCSTSDDIIKASKKALKQGPKAVLIKGGHGNGTLSQDYICGNHVLGYGKRKSFWLSGRRFSNPHTHGSGCSLASAIACGLALGKPLADAVVLAKAYIQGSIAKSATLGIGQGAGPVAHGREMFYVEPFPVLTESSENAYFKPTFPPVCDKALLNIGFYPILDSLKWCERLFPLGVTMAQLRLKDKSGKALRDEIARAITLARKHQIRLFINDAWELAVELGAYGVHLGQGDLDKADVHAIANAGLRLGISTHCEEELARALSFNPSYVALGPIFPTTSKEMLFKPQGLAKCKRWVRHSPVPVVAIGGIGLGAADKVMATGVSGIAVISAITQADDPEKACELWLNKCGDLAPKQNSGVGSTPNSHDHTQVDTA